MNVDIISSANKSTEALKNLAYHTLTTNYFSKNQRNNLQYDFILYHNNSEKYLLCCLWFSTEISMFDFLSTEKSKIVFALQKT